MVGSAILRILLRNGYDNLVCTYHRNVPENYPVYGIIGSI
jgi:hypothetical protein